MPPGIAATPWRVPLLEVAWLRTTPQREVGRVPLVLVHLDPRTRDALLGRLGVEARAVPGEGRDIEIHPVRGDVRVALRDQPLDERDHLRDVVRRLRDHLGIEDVQATT